MSSRNPTFACGSIQQVIPSVCAWTTTDRTMAASSGQRCVEDPAVQDRRGVGHRGQHAVEMLPASDGVIILRAFTASDGAIVLEGRDREWERWLGPGSPDSSPTACVEVGRSRRRLDRR